MEQLIPDQRRVTEDEYLRAEDTAKDKHEYRGGLIIDMAGASPEYIEVCMNLARQLGNRLQGKPCKVYGSDLRVRINKSGSYCYPDLTVVCGPLEFARPDRRSIIVNPQIAIEVSSASTENVDRGDKFTDYRQIDSLKEYFLVSQQRAQVESFYRQPDGIWAIGPTIADVNGSVRFRSLGIEVRLAEIYAGVTLPSDSTKAE